MFISGHQEESKSGVRLPPKTATGHRETSVSAAAKGQLGDGSLLAEVADFTFLASDDLNDIPRLTRK